MTRPEDKIADVIIAAIRFLVGFALGSAMILWSVLDEVRDISLLIQTIIVLCGLAGGAVAVRWGDLAIKKLLEMFGYV